MSSENSHWSLFHESTKVQLDGLTFAQIKGVIRTIDASHLNQWFAWHEGLADWKLVSQFPELGAGAASPRHLPPVPPSRLADSAANGQLQSNPLSLTDSQRDQLDETEKPLVQTFEMREDGTRVHVQLDRQGFVDHRQNRRFLKSYRVQIAARGHALDSFTVDISMGGMLLRDALPFEIPEAFDANLTHSSGQKLRISCYKVPPQPGGNWNRVKFNLIPETETILRTWLLGSDS